MTTNIQSKLININVPLFPIDEFIPVGSVNKWKQMSNYYIEKYAEELDTAMEIWIEDDMSNQMILLDKLAPWIDITTTTGLEDLQCLIYVMNELFLPVRQLFKKGTTPILLDSGYLRKPVDGILSDSLYFMCYPSIELLGTLIQSTTITRMILSHCEATHEKKMEYTILSTNTKLVNNFTPINVKLFTYIFIMQVDWFCIFIHTKYRNKLKLNLLNHNNVLCAIKKHIIRLATKFKEK